MQNKNEFALKMEGISKSFPGVKALDLVDFDLKHGEIHALVGENGAGKSTLVKILSGLYPMDTGNIIIDGKSAHIKSADDSKKAGISMIHQEFSLAETLTVAENLFIGRLFKTKYGLIDWKRINKEATDIMKKFNFSVDTNTITGKLSVAQKQMVEIAKAICNDSNILIMDEPTAALTEKEVQVLFYNARKLREQGVSIIYISHRIEEIFDVCDRVTVMRDGRVISTSKVSNVKRDSLIEMMVGRKMEVEFPIRENYATTIVLKVNNLTTKNGLNNINFELRSGETLGIYGLVGSGCSELARTIYGANETLNGDIVIGGNKRLINKSIPESISNGILMVSKDRKGEGLILEESIRENITIIDLKKISRFGYINRKKEKEIVNSYINTIGIKALNGEQKTLSLSGGNQQKVVISKCLNGNPSIIILDDPTRGIDVGAKYEIYLMLNHLKKSGKAIIYIASDLPEIIALSDRIMVLCDGKVAGVFNNDDNLTQSQILKLAIRKKTYE
jgi:ribose transport system ATP-binding protein